jgi:hypothetical protein
MQSILVRDRDRLTLGDIFYGAEHAQKDCPYCNGRGLYYTKVLVFDCICTVDQPTHDELYVFIHLEGIIP